MLDAAVFNLNNNYRMVTAFTKLPDASNVTAYLVPLASRLTT